MIKRSSGKPKKEWQIHLPEKFGGGKHVIRTRPFWLGSDNSCDIVIDHPSVEQRHVQFSLGNNPATIQVDDMAENPTLLAGEQFDRKTLNGKKNERTDIKAGDVDLVLYYGPVEHDGPADGKIPTEKNESYMEAPVRGKRNRENRRRSRGGFVCPFCWTRFKPEDMLFIAAHPDLAGDPVLGKEEQLRFLPRRVIPIRCALDAKGQKCTDMACPRCRLRVPSVFLDTAHFIVSTIGPVFSGKSYFLAISIGRLRKILFQYFELGFIDIDDSTNKWLNDYEERLFYSQESHGRIEKTQRHGNSVVQREVMIDGIKTFLPVPSILTLSSRGPAANSNGVNLSVMFYDNSGEHFQAGQDSIDAPGTLHMLRAKGLQFLFDPSAEPRFHDLIEEPEDKRIYQQRKIILETIDRLRRHMGLAIDERLKMPVVVVLSKADLLKAFARLHADLKSEPWVWLKKGKLAALDFAYIETISAKLRNIFDARIPEFVNSVEAFAENVLYMPVSALGHRPGGKAVKATDIEPMWAEIPFLCILAKNGLVPSFRKKDEKSPEPVSRKKYSVAFDIPGTGYRLEMPSRYKGAHFTWPGSGVRFSVP